MKAGTAILSVLTAAALAGMPFTGEVSAQTTGSREQVRIVIENHTLSTENGADWTGTLVDEWVAIDADSTAKDLFLTVLSVHDYTQQGAEFDYITEINGLSAEDGGAMGGWMIQLDDWITDEGLSAYTVSSGKLVGGDTVCFSYSCAWGADLDYDWSGSDTALSDVVFSAGTLSPDFSANTFDYQLILPEGTDSVTIQPTVGNRAYRAKIYKNTYTPADNTADYKTWEDIAVADGDTVIVGVANANWMQNNYNNAAESVYQFHIGHAAKPVDTQVQAVESLIEAIGTVTADSGRAIETAANAFNSLSAEQQAQVSNADILKAAQTAYAALLPEKTVLTAAELKERYAHTISENPVYGNEWDIINLCRFGLATEDMKQQYVESVRQALQENGSAMLSATRSTVNSGVVTALTACGMDASDFYGYDLTAPLNDIEYVQKQGLNGVVYALLALDTHHYPTSDTRRDSLVSAVLAAQETDGGWTIDTWTGVEDGSDADMTAMALQALAPYRNDEKVHTAVERALNFLSAQQNEKGQFFSYGHYDCESAAQVLTALCALSLDPSQEERFIKNGLTAYDALLNFFHEQDNGFSHFEDGASNYLSTYQAYAAIAAYDRFLNGQTPYFDMTDITLTKPETSQPDESSQPSVTEESDPVSSEPSAAEGASTVVSIPDDYVKTGDTAPLYAVLVILLTSAALWVVSRKHSSK